MKNDLATCFVLPSLRRALLLVLGAALFLTCLLPVPAQQKDKKKKKDAASATDNSKPLTLLSDEQQIDYLLSDMLGAWQIGDVEKLHQDYADDVSLVNASWAPPIIGWTNYLAIYQQQRAHVQRVRMDRTNTYIKVSGTGAWACYQWDFEGVVDGNPNRSQGQTTVVLEKRNNRWVIVHNHTSLAPGVPQAAPPNPPPAAQPPAKPPAR